MKVLTFPLHTHRLASQQTNLAAELSKFVGLQPLIPLVTANPKLALLLKIMLHHRPELLAKSVYQQRLIQELVTMSAHVDADSIWDYLLILEDVAQYYTQQNQLVNINRGSAGGSLVNYCLGITQLDPVKYGLIFERWFRLEEVIDIDMDIYDRERLQTYLSNKYGSYYQPLKVEMRWKLKAALAEVLTGQIKYARIAALKTVVDEYNNFRFRAEYQEKLSTERGFFEFLCQQQREFGLFFNAHPHWQKQMLKILDTPTAAMGTHASGCTISNPHNLNFAQLEQARYPKFDFLQPKVYELLHSRRVTPQELNQISITPAGCQRVLESSELEMFTEARAVYDSQMAAAPPTNLIDLAVLFAKGRPANFIVADCFKCEINHAQVQAILSETYGELIFQEQLMEILHQVFKVPMMSAYKIYRKMLTRDLVYDEIRHTLLTEAGLEHEPLLAFMEARAAFLFLKAHALGLVMASYLVVGK